MGERYLVDIARAFEAMRTATVNLTESRRRRHLKIRAYTTFSRNWLIPRLSSFHLQHPDIEVILTTSLHAVDFSPPFSLRQTTNPVDFSRNVSPNRFVLSPTVVRGGT